MRRVFVTPEEFLKSVLAGSFIALGAFASQIAGMYGGRVLAAIVFPIGLILVLFTNTNLFTGKCLLIENVYTSQQKALRVVMKLGFYWVCNFLGALIIFNNLVISGLVPTEIQTASVALAESKCAIGLGALLFRSILCNCCVCLAVICYRKVGVIGAFIPTFLFVLCGFEHSVADMYYIPMGMYYGANITIGGFLLNTLIPITIGNMLGGFFVGAAHYILEGEKYGKTVDSGS